MGSHHDDVVSQYTVWAITENPCLGLRDLGIDLRDIERKPTNVRSWVFQLVAMHAEDAQKYFEFVQLGTEDPEPDARAGLALGLRDTFFDGLEVLVLDWFTSEDNDDVSQSVLDHLVRQATRCPSYESMALDSYERAPAASSQRLRMQAHAARTALYGKFKRIDFDGQSDLFRKRDSNMTNNTYNISGGIQAGAVTLGGDAENSGTTSVHYQPQVIESIQSELANAERELHAMKLDPNLTRDALAHVKAAKADPNPEKISKALDLLGKVDDVAKKTIGTVTALAPIAAAIGRAAGLM